MMLLKRPISLFPIAFAATLSLTACNDFAFHVATYPEGIITALQSPTPVWDYENSINPGANIRIPGPYDIEDLYRDENGFPLPGALQIR